MKGTQSSSSLLLLSELTQALPMDESKQCEYCLLKIKYLISKEKNIFNKEYARCVFKLFVLIIVSQEIELHYFGWSTK